MKTTFRYSILCGTALAAILFSSPLFAEIKLASVFGDGMVLQREMPVPVWGTAEPNEEVTVEIAGITAAVKTAKNGGWSLRLPPLPVGGPYTMNVSGSNSLSVENVLVGDVWLCSGQSNMQFSVKKALNAETEIAAANDAELRLLTVPRVSESTPKYAQGGQWTVCSPKTIPEFSAVAYFFGREMRKELGVPVGLIHASWGGSSCEAWIQPELLPDIPLLETLADSKRNEKMAPQKKTGGLYHGMILPIRPYAIRGVIWYQGESNAGRALQYRILFPAMISHWREIWEEGDFPFYFVQLANFMKSKEEPGESAWAELREAQTAAESLRRVHGVTTIDIGEADDIHPKNKQDVGLRLARLVLADEFGRDLVSSGPRLSEMKIRGGEAILSFTDLGGGLQIGRETSEPAVSRSDAQETAASETAAQKKTPASEEKTADKNAEDAPAAETTAPELTGFAVAGADRKFYWAAARIDGDRVIVSSPDVPRPVAVRYGWADNPRCNLYNAEHLPAVPFRTDSWPGVGDYNR